MSRRFWTSSITAAAVVLAGWSLYSQLRPAPDAAKVLMTPAAAQSFIIKLGIGDQNATAWDGKLSLSAGAILKIEGWRFADVDVAGAAGWKCSTRLSQGISGPGPIYENGVIATALFSDPATSFTVSTLQGSFSFVPKNLTMGTAKTYLSGKASVEPVPVTTELTTSFAEQDFPAVAQDGDDVWVSYVEFTHSNRSQETWTQFKTAPASFDYLARPAGGDQVMLMHYSKAQRTWDAPLPVSDANQDVMRTAVAVDGGKRVWVFWSANLNGNFDIYAKYWDPKAWQRGWSSAIRMTTDPGTDLNPVAATDSTGRVWLAWQGYRNNNLEILARSQEGLGFWPETTVSFSPANDWDPAIAAASNGDVAISWDTYDKGDYDVYFRRVRANGGIQMDAPTPVAASTNFEARSSLAYDRQNRLWVAYEVSVDGWGKDWGAYDTSGVALYQGHTIRLKCFQGSSAFGTAVDLTSVLPKPTALPQMPDPTLAAKRAPSGSPTAPAGPKQNFPRLAIDPDGQVYLAYRATTGNRNQIGTIWAERVIYYDGAKWNGPVTLTQTDAVLDNRPALAPLDGGDLMVVSAMDHRQSPVYVNGTHDIPGGIEFDLYAAELLVGRTQQPMNLAAIPAETVAQPDNGAQAEAGQVQTMRNYRASVSGQNLQLVRGEFHRHSELSFDGGSDGPLVDQYRYLIDAGNMDWAMCCDHDNGTGREYSWWMIQKYTDAYNLPGRYLPMFGYERSVNYPEGHRNVLFAQRGVRPLQRLPLSSKTVSAPAPDTLMLYDYVRHFGGVVASHTSGTDMGTDWRNSDPKLEPIVEIYQGDRQNYEMPGAPRTNTADDSIGGWEPLGFVSLALQNGYRLGFEASSDHISTHMSYANVFVTEPSRQALLDALAKRHVYASTDNILADVRCGNNFMGDDFTVSAPPVIQVKLEGTANFSKVYIVKDGAYVYTSSPGSSAVDFTWQDTAATPGKTSYYYIRGEQENGELVWASPMWITYQ